MARGRKGRAPQNRIPIVGKILGTIDVSKQSIEDSHRIDRRSGFTKMMAKKLHRMLLRNNVKHRFIKSQFQCK